MKFIVDKFVSYSHDFCTIDAQKLFENIKKALHTFIGQI